MLWRAKQLRLTQSLLKCGYGKANSTPLAGCGARTAGSLGVLTDLGPPWQSSQANLLRTWQMTVRRWAKALTGGQPCGANRSTQDSPLTGLVSRWDPVGEAGQKFIKSKGPARVLLWSSNSKSTHGKVFRD